MSYGGSGGGSGSIANSSDVALNNPANGQVLTYSSSLQKWKNLTASGTAGATVIAIGSLGSGQTISLASGNDQTVVATANQATSNIAFSNVAAGAHWSMALAQDATGGRTVNWSGVTWIPGGPPTLGTGPNAVDLLEFMSPDGSNIYGFHSNPHYARSTLPFAAPNIYEVFNRMESATTITMVSGNVYLTHFVPDRDQVITTLFSYSTVVPSGLTMGRVGIYVYNGSSTYTCVARSTGGSGFWPNIASYNVTLVDDGNGNALASYTLKAGVEYAFAAIAYASAGFTTAPKIGAATYSAGLEYPSSYGVPKMGSMAQGQTDLPPSLSTGSTLPPGLVWGAAI